MVIPVYTGPPYLTKIIVFIALLGAIGFGYITGMMFVFYMALGVTFLLGGWFANLRLKSAGISALLGIGIIIFGLFLG